MKFLLSFLSIAFIFNSFSFGGPNCFDQTKSCDPDLLCTFKAEYYGKLVGSIAYTMNDVRTKKKKNGIEGVRYDGSIRQESIDEAIKNNPNDSKSEQLEKAGQIFQQKIAKQIQKSYSDPICQHGGKINNSKAPPEGYQGMTTTEDCQIKVVYYDSEYPTEPFIHNGSACFEFYERDMAHEKIHQKRCEAAKKVKNSPRFQIDNLIAEETDAYRHSVQLSEAYMKFLNLQCSSKLKDPKGIKKTMNKINNLLKPYL